MPRVQPELSGFASLRFQRRARLGGEEPNVRVEVWGYGDGLLVFVAILFKTLFFLSFFYYLWEQVYTTVCHFSSSVAFQGDELYFGPCSVQDRYLPGDHRVFQSDCVLRRKAYMACSCGGSCFFVSGAVQVVNCSCRWPYSYVFFCFWVLTAYRVLFLERSLHSSKIPSIIIKSSSLTWWWGISTCRSPPPSPKRSCAERRNSWRSNVQKQTWACKIYGGFFPLLESHLEAVQAKGAVRKGWPRRLTGGRGEEEEGETKRAGFHFGPIPPRVTMLVSQIHRLENGVVFLNIW